MIEILAALVGGGVVGAFIAAGIIESTRDRQKEERREELRQYRIENDIYEIKGRLGMERGGPPPDPTYYDEGV